MLDQEKVNAALERVHSRLGNTEQGLTDDFLHYLCHTMGRELTSDNEYKLRALSFIVRDRLMSSWKATWTSYRDQAKKRAYYLSMEFLIGRSLSNNMLNLGIEAAAENALHDLGLALEEVEDTEVDAGLGNGGLGRLAACFMDSCATLQLPVVGYGLRYEYGMFKQHIQNGFQVEEPDHWLGFGFYPWEVQRNEYTRIVKFGGYTRPFTDPHTGLLIVHWEDAQEIHAVPFDVPIPGYKNNTVNTLRLWDATAAEEFKLCEFNAGSYFEAVSAKNEAENITMVLYPNDSSENGKELRLRQQYFLVSASLQDVVGQWRKHHNNDMTHFAEANVFQLNDTHPSLAVAELMRILLDECHMGWDPAWAIVSSTMAYTNHTLLPEALEQWPVDLMRRLLPRPLEIIEEINRRFLRQVALKWPGDIERQHRLAIVDGGMVRMAYLAIVGSFSVNGVAALHSQLLKDGLFRDFYQLWPHKFNNKTNGVTQRRWMGSANPGLRQLLNETLGEKWITQLSELQGLEAHLTDSTFRARWAEVKLENKRRLAQLIERETGIVVQPTALFDVQVKRIHEYKRQLLNALHVIHLYARIKRGDTENWTNRVVIFGGKAAPGYAMAKNIIKLINNVAQVVNNDPDVGDLLKVVFIPNYRVSAMEIICPGTDLSEQISTAGKEASGTGNMKFMMNGAVTIGTLDGANVEIREAVGEENFFLFGLRTEEVQSMQGHYNPQYHIDEDADLRAVLYLLEVGHFSQFEEGIFDPILASIKSPHDQWMTLADFRSYVSAQEAVAQAYQDKERWTSMSILNSARSGIFSTDRTMEEYNRDIWKLQPIKIDK